LQLYNKFRQPEVYSIKSERDPAGIRVAARDDHNNPKTHICRILELLEGYDKNQDIVETRWNQILADSPSETTEYLHWIYESHQGSRAKKNALFDMFLADFFPQHTNPDVHLSDADQICATVDSLHKDILNCRKLVTGQWLYHPIQQPINGWDISRLSILSVELGHTLSIPLLLAAHQLNQKKFSDIVQTIERIFFRYKIVCNQHVTPLKKIYHEESKAIRENPQDYNTISLKTKLEKLINSKASDTNFRNNLNLFEYKDVGGSNKPLKYFLMTIEHYYQWYRNGATGKPECIDKSRVYDFAGTSIEHIYPRNAASNVKDENIEQLKNTIGNLTIMDPSQNGIGSNKSFLEKQYLYQRSSVLLTKEVGSKTAWTKADVEQHRDLLINAALAIFRP